MKRIKKKVKRAVIPHAENNFQPSILKPRSLFILAVVLLVIKFLVFSWLFYFPKTIEFAVVTGSELIQLANKERVALGFQPLKINQQLVQAAQQKAQDMLNKDYFAHTSPDGISPWHWLDKAGYEYKAAGENLAKDFTDSYFLHQAWMNSSSHRDNILDKNYKEIGIAVIEGQVNGQTTTLAVQFFGLSYAGIAQKEEILESEPLVISETNIELETVEIETKGEETSLKGPLVFKEQENLEQAPEEPKGFLAKLKQDSEAITQKFYFIILGLMGLVLLLAVFVNIRVQYPKMIFRAVIFLIFVAAIALFNTQEILNKGIDII